MTSLPISMHEREVCPCSALTNRVFPLPGGPYSSTPLRRLSPLEKSSGYLSVIPKRWREVLRKG